MTILQTEKLSFTSLARLKLYLKIKPEVRQKSLQQSTFAQENYVHAGLRQTRKTTKWTV